MCPINFHHIPIRITHVSLWQQPKLLRICIDQWCGNRLAWVACILYNILHFDARAFQQSDNLIDWVCLCARALGMDASIVAWHRSVDSPTKVNCSICRSSYQLPLISCRTHNIKYLLTHCYSLLAASTMGDQIGSQQMWEWDEEISTWPTPLNTVNFPNTWNAFSVPFSATYLRLWISSRRELNKNNERLPLLRGSKNEFT